jgi:hypothetical protein
MIIKSQFLSIFMLVSILGAVPSALAVDTELIDVLRQRTLNSGSLTADDVETIDSFWNEATEEMVLSNDFSKVVTIRTMLSARRGTNELSQYTSSYIMSAQKYLDSAFDEVKGWEPGPLKQHIERNLLILVAELQSTELADFALDRLENDNSLIRYWKVKALTDPKVASQLRSGSNAELADRIIQRLQEVAQKENQPVILNMIAAFATRMDQPEAKQLLLKVADLRIEAYKNWAVDNEISETTLLKLLGNEITGRSGEQKITLLRKFAQLYSFVMQRYIAGAEVLDDNSKHQLVSVMVEVEQAVLSRLLDMPRSAIKRAIEKEDFSVLQREHDTLFGSTVRVGELGREFNFDYGKSSSERPITEPEKLTSPPEDLLKPASEEAGS